MRLTIDTQDRHNITEKNIQDRLNALKNQKGLTRKETNTEIVKTGIEVEERREKIKEEIVQIGEIVEEEYNAAAEKLKERYDIDKVEVYEGSWNIVIGENQYDWRYGEQDIELFNGDNVESKHCPECHEQDWEVIKLEDIEYQESDLRKGMKKKIRQNEESDTSIGIHGNRCNSCGTLFTEFHRETIPDEEELGKARRYGELRWRVMNTCKGIIDKIVNYNISSGYGRPREYGHVYRNGFQEVDVSFWPTEKGRIQFRIEDFHSKTGRPFFNNWPHSNVPNTSTKDALEEDYVLLLDHLSMINNRQFKPLNDKKEVIIVNPRDDEEEVGTIEMPLNNYGYELEEFSIETVKDHVRENTSSELLLESNLEDLEGCKALKIVNDKQIEKEGGKQ